jgi:hypothetical protein
MKLSLLMLSLLTSFGMTISVYGCCQKTGRNECSNVHKISCCCYSSPATTIENLSNIESIADGFSSFPLFQ